MKTTLTIDAELLEQVEVFSIKPVPPENVMQLIETRRLFNRGIGYVDTHLLASCLIHGNCQLLTRDRHLHEAAQQLGIAA